jgi:stage III sporulation protein AA
MDCTEGKDMTKEKTHPLKWMNEILSIFPPSIAAALKSMDYKYQSTLEEIRIRENAPLFICAMGKNLPLSADGSVGRSNAYIVSTSDCRELLMKLSGYSIYALQEEMKRGFITLKGGYRVGLAGKTVLSGGEVKLISPVSCFNIRISREIPGCSAKLLPYITQHKRPLNTLIVSSPQMGKTTMLRDIARHFSNLGCNEGGYKVVIVDERSELAGCCEGVAQNDVGKQTDVLDGCPKALGIMMALRGLSPQVIVTDEIGSGEDTQAIMEAVNCGVTVIASAHAGSIEELKRRTGTLPLIQNGVFERIVMLTSPAGTVKEILSGNLERMHSGFSAMAEGIC